MRALIAEGDLASATRIRAAIEPEGFIVEAASEGEEALELAKVYDFDIAILGPRLADMEGADLLRRLRQAELAVPALMLTTADDRPERIRLLVAGADDVLVKPVDRAELAARLRAIVRRAKGHATSVIRTGRMTLDLASRTVAIDGKPLPVTPKEYGILELLSLRRGKTLTKEMFLDHLYGGMDEPEQKIVDVFICKLRKKIAKVAGDEGPIQTVWGQGYTLREGTPGLAEMEAAFEIEGMPPGPVNELGMLFLQFFPQP